MINRRLSKRIPFNKRIRYGLFEPNHLGYTLNISEGGIGIESDTVFPPKSRVVVYLYGNGVELENDERNKVLLLEGIVTWVYFTFPGIPSTMGITCTNRTKNIAHIYEEKRIKTNVIPIK